MTFAQRQNRLTTHFSERIPVVKLRLSVRLVKCLKPFGVSEYMVLPEDGADERRNALEF
jgi:hypothetical protein